MMGEEEPIFVTREVEEWYNLKTAIMKNMIYSGWLTGAMITLVRIALL